MRISTFAYLNLKMYFL